MTTQNWPPIPFGGEKGRKRRKKIRGEKSTPAPVPDGPGYDWIKNLPVVDSNKETLVIFIPRLPPVPPKLKS